MTNKEALDIVLKVANRHAHDRHAHDYGQDEETLAALSQMEDYYNDVMEDNTNDSAFPPMED